MYPVKEFFLLPHNVFGYSISFAFPNLIYLPLFLLPAVSSDTTDFVTLGFIPV